MHYEEWILCLWVHCKLILVFITGRFFFTWKKRIWEVKGNDITNCIFLKPGFQKIYNLQFKFRDYVNTELVNQRKTGKSIDCKVESDSINRSCFSLYVRLIRYRTEIGGRHFIRNRWEICNILSCLALNELHK